MSLVTTATALSILLVIAIILMGCVLPIVIIWLIIRKKTNETDKRTQLALAVLEKNPEIDVEELLKKTAPKPKLLKEKLLKKLFWGSLTTIIGVIAIGDGIWSCYVGGDDEPMSEICIGLIWLGVGIAFLINYFMGKKMLAKEIEAEERQMTTQA